MADPKMEIINDCAVALCKFLGRDPNEPIPIPHVGGGPLIIEHPLWRLIRGRIFECVVEVSKIVESPPFNGGDGEGSN